MAYRPSRVRDRSACAGPRSTRSAGCAHRGMRRDRAAIPGRSSWARARPACTGRAARARRRPGATRRSDSPSRCSGASGSWRTSLASSRGEPVGRALGTVLARYGAARPQPCPEVLHGVGAVGAPALGESLGGGAAVLSELLEGVTDAEVGREEGVGVAQGAGRAGRRTPLSRLHAPPRPRELAVARAPVRPNP